MEGYKAASVECSYKRAATTGNNRLGVNSVYTQGVEMTSELDEQLKIKAL